MGTLSWALTTFFFNVPLFGPPKTGAEEGDGRGEDGRRKSERLKRVWPLEPPQGATTPTGLTSGVHGVNPWPGNNSDYPQEWSYARSLDEVGRLIDGWLPESKTIPQ
jgi:hypothetical protein